MADLPPNGEIMRDPYAIVAFGDSTTAKSGDIRVYAELLEEKTLSDGRTIKVYNAGIPSNTTADARKRFDTDVIARKPDAVIIQLGINDSACDVWKTPPVTEPRVSLATYRENLVHFITKAREEKIRVILMTPNPMTWKPIVRDLYGKPPYVTAEVDDINISLKDYVAAMREIAKEQQVELIDVNAYYENADAKGQPFDTFLLDGIHPNAQGHELVATLLTEHLDLKKATTSQR